MNSEKDMSRRDALKTMGAMIATAALSTSGLSACANPKKKVADKKRLVFYFTATGNSLYVARELAGNGGEVLSIPQLMDQAQWEFEADEIGFVFPDFAAVAPLMVREFVSKSRFKASYLFSVITYGNFAANVAEWWDGFCKTHGLTNHYVNTLLMVDNYLPVFDMNEQIKIDKKIPENLATIVADVSNRRQYVARFDRMDERMQGFLTRLQNEHFPMEAERLLKLDADACIACNTCDAVCPHGNFRLTDTVVAFSGACEYCLACVHACPQKALTLVRGERNPKARFRNENVSLADIKRANNRNK